MKRKVITLLILASLLLVIPTQTLAQKNNLSVRVLDKENTPIRDVSVRLVDENSSTGVSVTDESISSETGWCSLLAENGNYTLIAEKEGYGVHTEEISLKTSKTKVINLSGKQSVIKEFSSLIISVGMAIFVFFVVWKSVS